MNLDFADYTITIAIVPVDLRAGYSRLSAIALTLMKIDVDQGNDVVIFISCQATSKLTHRTTKN